MPSTCIRTLHIGPHKHEFFLELSAYPSGQPELLLRPYLKDGPAVTLTFELPALDLRAYDADFGFRRRHLLFRTYGTYQEMFTDLQERRIIRPVGYAVTDGNQTAHVCQIDLSYCVITPEPGTYPA